MKLAYSICQTTARVPDGWRAAAEAWLANCDRPEESEYILCVDERDYKSLLKFAGDPPRASWQGLPPWPPYATLVTNYHAPSSTNGFNCAAKQAKGNVIILVADDSFPCPHWDTELSKVIAEFDGIENMEFVIHVSTGSEHRDPQLISLPILNRARYDRLGYALYPEYPSVFADDDFTEHAYRDAREGRCVVIVARQLMFEHRHHSFGKAPEDAVYQWQNRPEAYKIGAQIFTRRRQQGFAT